MENKMFDVKTEDGAVVLSVDSNKDGEAVAKLKMFLAESAAEAFARGEAVEGEATVKFKFDPISGIKVGLDTDRDGEVSLELEVSSMEAIDEIKSAFSKKDEA